jgi:alpha-L-fucosidase
MQEKSLFAQNNKLNLNDPEREEWFSNLGFGMFIHWSLDVQLGMVISHSMVGASEEYINRYINDLPKTFNPEKFDANDFAKSAKQAGMNYVVFTAKHHNGFCMYNTSTTDFNILNTPYGKDVTKEIIEAFRSEGLAIGLYFSPDDFYFLYKQGTPISRRREEATASHNEELNDYTKKQMRELMTQYGDVDIVFLDGLDQFAQTELAKICWEINPQVMVTRGVMETPEQKTPESPLPSPWEACYTLGNQWQFRPTNEEYKSANTVINKLIEIRAKGGNLLLNVGPDAQGRFPSEQKGILNEVALWMFINQEAFKDTKPHKIIREGDIWFLKREEPDTYFFFITNQDWEFGKRESFTINSFKAKAGATISLLGHNGKVLEYHPEVDPSPTITNATDGLDISVMRAQRIYNDRTWTNPLVLRVENIKPND